VPPGDEYPEFGLQNVLTRAEALTLTIRLLGLEQQALAYTGTHPFSDVPSSHWAYQYVAYGYNNGITRGASDTLYAPEVLVTFHQFTTFLLRILDYVDCEDEYNCVNCNHDFAYSQTRVFAQQIGLYADPNELFTELGRGAFLRRNAVLAMCRALVANMNGSSNTTLLDTLVAAGVIVPGNMVEGIPQPAGSALWIIVALDELDMIGVDYWWRY